MNRTASAFDLLVPIRSFDVAKSRLLGVTTRHRRALVQAFAEDALAAARGSSLVASITVVTGDSEVVAWLGEQGVRDQPDEGAGDLNAALRAGVLGLPEAVGRGMAVMLADLPCVTAADLDAALSAVTCPAFVADAEAVGTTLIASPGRGLTPHFGPGSRSAHAQAGLVELPLELPRLRRDVDTAADLRAAVRLGVGARTQRVLAALDVGEVPEAAGPNSPDCPASPDSAD